jgi:hypothetical protein
MPDTGVGYHHSHDIPMIREEGDQRQPRDDHPPDRKHRSLSTPRTGSHVVQDKPKKPRKYLSSGSSSLTSIPNAIKLSMLNSGLLSLGEPLSMLQSPWQQPLFALIC